MLAIALRLERQQWRVVHGRIDGAHPPVFIHWGTIMLHGLIAGVLVNERRWRKRRLVMSWVLPLMMCKRVVVLEVMRVHMLRVKSRGVHHVCMHIVIKSRHRQGRA